MIVYHAHYQNPREDCIHGEHQDLDHHHRRRHHHHVGTHPGFGPCILEVKGIYLCIEVKENDCVFEENETSNENEIVLLVTFYKTWLEEE